MARIVQVVGRDPLQLLELAAESFLAPVAATEQQPFPSPDYVLVLRQGGLRDDLIALAGQRGIPGWFDPPLCVFHELPEWLGCTDRAPCGDFARAALLGKIVRQVGTDVFLRARRLDDLLPALEQLLGDLIAEDVTPDQLAQAVTAPASIDVFTGARNRELVAIYRRYVQALERSGLRDGRDTLVDCARAIHADPSGLAQRLGGRREIRIVGLADPRGGWRVLLNTLAANRALDRIVIYSSDALPLGDGLHVETHSVEGRESSASHLFDDEEPGGTHVITVEARTVERELGEVGRRIRALADQGVPLHRIAVVARQARPYVEYVLRALHRYGVPASARRRLSYREIPVVRAVLALYRAAADGWSRPTLVELADLPYFAHQLDSRVLNYIGFRRRMRGLSAWANALGGLESEADRHEMERDTAKERREQPPPPVTRVIAARRNFAAFAERAIVLEAPRTLGEWLGGLVDWLREDPWRIQERIYAVPEDRFDVAKRDITGWRGFTQILEEWQRAIATWGGAEEQLTIARFSGRLTEMLAGDVGIWSESPRGVRVLEALAAAYRSFDHVFLVGMSEGQFPLPAPGSPLSEESERADWVAAGLPLDTRDDWDARERNLFRVLVASARDGLTLSFPRLNAAGQEVSRSSFVDALVTVATETRAAVDPHSLITEAMPLLRTPQAAEQAVRAARIEAIRTHGVPSPYTGYVEDPELRAWLAEQFGDHHLWSPTQLESYARCPWAFFSGRLLRVEKLEDPDDEMEPAVRGSLLHDTLARFYRAAVMRNGGRPVVLDRDAGAWMDTELTAAMDASLDAFRTTAWLGAPVLRRAKRAELLRLLRRYLEWEIQLHEDMHNPRKRTAPLMIRTAVALHERWFDHAVLERDGVRFEYRGAIDRVEIGVDPRIADAGRFMAAVDYKTSKLSTPGMGDKGAWEEGVVLQLPLYAHALEQLVEGARVARIEYRALVERARVHQLDLHQVNPKQGIRHPNQRELAKMERALERVPALVRRVRNGVFPAEPPPSCLCPHYCHAWDICRTPGGPKTKETWR